MPVIWTKVNTVIDAVNDDITNQVRGGMTGARLTMYILKTDGIGPRLYPLGNKEADYRVWTRGDGVRYKEPGYIQVLDDNARRYRNNFSTFKTLYPGKQEILDHVWETLKRRPQAKDMGWLSGSFNSHAPSPALRASGLLWVRREWGIEYSSMSRLKNEYGVWRHTPPQETE